NGLAIDGEQMIWVAESNPPALLRMRLDGSFETVLERSADGPLLFPNDLCFGPDGMLYFTDSGIRFPDFAPGGKVRADYDEVTYKGRVYRLDPRTRALALLDDNIRFTNGIAFGPGDTYLYVAETVTGDIIRYTWSPAGLGAPEVFANVIAADAPAGMNGPDGMAFGRNGDL